MKKFILLPLLVIAASSPLFAQFSIANLATGSLSDYDRPLIDAINYFARTFFSFHRIALVLATALGFIGVVWHAFKIIFGTENVRKASVDIMCKFLLFTFVMAFYPSVTGGILNLATGIGMHAGGGYATLLAEFGAFRKEMEDKVDLARRDIDRMLASVADPANSNGKNIQITERLMNDIVKRTAVTEDDKDAIIAEMQKNYNIISDADYKKHKWTERAVTVAGAPFGAGGMILANKLFNKFDPNKNYNDLAAVSKAVDGKQARAIAKSGQEGDSQGWDSPAVKHAVVSLKAMQEIFDKNPEYDPDMAGSRGYTTEKYLFNPFMRGVDAPTYVLSPGAMIKTGVVIADIINFQSTKDFDENGDLVDKEITTEKKKGLMSIMMSSIQETVFSFLFTVGIIAACAFCAVQYCMTVFEFFILTSVGIIFVPCILWDGTKSFAAKLITLFLAYFFKLMLMLLCLLWVYGFFLKFGMTIMTKTPVLSLLNVGYFIFAVLLGWAVTQNGPKLATALLNGTPDLSMGEFMRAAGTAVAGAYAAKRAAGAVQKAGSAAHKGLQGSVNTFAGLDAMRGGVSGAVNAQGDRQGWGAGERLRRTAGGVAGLIGQNIKNSAVTFFTGTENKGDHTENVSNMGKGKSANNDGAGGQQTYGNARTAAQGYANERMGVRNNNNPGNAAGGGDNAGINANPRQPDAAPRPDTAPQFDGRRDTGANPA